MLMDFDKMYLNKDETIQIHFDMSTSKSLNLFLPSVQKVHFCLNIKLMKQYTFKKS